MRKLNRLTYNKILDPEKTKTYKMCVILMLGKKLFQQSYLYHRQENPS